jgi:hypothetical protein
MRDEDTRLTGFEAQLAALAPQTKLDRDRVMFAAGERAGLAKARRTSRWMLSANLVMVAALVASWTMQPGSQPQIAAPSTQPIEKLAEDARPETFDGSVVDSTNKAQGPTHLQLMERLVAGGSGGSELAHVVEPASSANDEANSSEVRVLLQRYLDSPAGQF